MPRPGPCPPPRRRRLPPVPSPRPADARVYFIAPTDGARIRGPFVVQFGLRNMGVTQAGSAAQNAGHHHLLVDVQESVAAEGPIPADKSHLHFGAGQTETRLDLPPGRHTLQLVLGDATTSRSARWSRLRRSRSRCSRPQGRRASASGAAPEPG